jgi:hypothetical protein
MGRKPVLIDMGTAENGEIVERPEDEDSEAAWDGWISDLRRSSAAGIIRVAKLPTDENGDPLPNAKGQIQLGSWPHDQFDYDGLLAHIRQKFMKPGETIHVRIMGMETGKPGVKVNNIVSLQRDAAPSGSEAVTSQLGEVLLAMREDRAALTNTLQTILTPKEAPSPAPSMFTPAIKELITIGLPIVGGIVTALISRPAKPPADLVGLVEIARMLKGDTHEEKEDDNSIASIVKAVAPNGLQLLTTMLQNSQRTAPVRVAAPSASRPVSLPVVTAPMSVTEPAATIETVPESIPLASKESEDASVFALLKPQLIELVALAERNEHPADVAKLTAQLLPSSYDEMLSDLLDSPESFSRLAVLEPKIANHAAWFEQLRVALRNELFEDEPPVKG